jgi:hypothetical protein
MKSEIPRQHSLTLYSSLSLTPRSGYLWTKLKNIHGSLSTVLRGSGPACVIRNQLVASLRLVANVMNDDFMTTRKAFWGGIIKIQDWAACFFWSRRSLNSLYAYADPI